MRDYRCTEGWTKDWCGYTCYNERYSEEGVSCVNWNISALSTIRCPKLNHTPWSGLYWCRSVIATSVGR